MGKEISFAQRSLDGRYGIYVVPGSNTFELVEFLGKDTNDIVAFKKISVGNPPVDYTNPGTGWHSVSTQITDARLDRDDRGLFARVNYDIINACAAFRGEVSSEVVKSGIRKVYVKSGLSDQTPKKPGFFERMADRILDRILPRWVDKPASKEIWACA
ncbi:MAG: hypothetical protein JSW08_01705 [archaeon]|nr:MAG: hypothetical protein JSW08_01705 [archaeon]